MGYKRPESVLVVVHTSDARVLMLRRRSPAEFWQSVTGSLEWGESPEAAARRELLEETGLATDGLEDRQRINRFPIVPPWRERYAPDANENIEHVFSLLLPEPCPVRLNDREHVEYRWATEPEALALASSYTNRDAIRELVGALPDPESKAD
ncbi:MAG: dihydroneopterin triphosphate diphosphatase [Chromatiales bacterium]|jgi:dATP pyrophosphohydrolase